MKITKFFPLVLAPALFISCNGEPEFETTESGLIYMFHREADEKLTAAIGDILELEFVMKSANDSVLDDTRKHGSPQKVSLNESMFKGDLYEGLAMLSVNDSATFMFSADSFFKHYSGGQLPEFIKSGENLTFGVTLKSIQPKAEFEKEKEKKMAEMQKQMAERQQQEAIERDAYLKQNNIIVKPTESGLYYLETKKGKGKKAETGKTVLVHYTGKFLDGRVFDSSVQRNQPLELTLGQGQVIPAWEEAVGYMQVGTKATIVAPSHLSYGERGYPGAIPPFSTLVFEMELVEIK